MKGLDIGDTYTARQACCEFIYYIAEHVRKMLRNSVQDCKFLAVLSDGVTDTAVIEQEIVYIRYTIAGNTTTHLVSVEPVEKADAVHISSAIVSAMADVDATWKQKLVATGTDGANVMVGNKAGVVQLLKGERDFVVRIHCMNHRLELSFRDAAKATNCHKKLSALLLGLYLFYKNSPLNRANFNNSFKALGKKPLVPARACGTRWVGHMQKAVDNFLKGHKATVQHLQQIQSPDAQGVRGDQQAKAKNFFQLATSLSIVKYACFLHDVLHHSRTCQTPCSLTRSAFQRSTTHWR